MPTELDDEKKKLSGGKVKVVYVLRRNAKSAKEALDSNNMLNHWFRMAPAYDTLDQSALGSRIAIPVVDSYCSSLNGPWKEFVVGEGIQNCPYSTAVLGNRRPLAVAATTKVAPFSDMKVLNLNQQAILRTIKCLSLPLGTCSRNGPSEEHAPSWSGSDRTNDLIEKIRGFDNLVMPKSCEIFGDDRTIVINPLAFISDEFLEFLSDETGRERSECMDELWTTLATVHRSNRIVRRGTVDPGSKIRESGYRLVWPVTGIPKESGPGSNGWITVTEQGIRQSFDMTRVMFSRGNISEKIRFGKLVKQGDMVLDLYAGIGYYTLPAVIHGGASHVVACEWNEYAIEALRYNVRENCVEDRVTIIVGDCRSQAREHNLVNKFDRVSLGLLPSSEGGWKTAVRALKYESGGWLHVHGNVPDREKEEWLGWMCRRLLTIVDEETLRDGWVVLCRHLERVKSFAPTISHYVADVYLGPNIGLDNPIEFRCGFYRGNSLLIPCREDIQPPSCALSSSGVLNHEWMRDE